MQSLGLYVHIPFCERKCPYCDFNTYAGLHDLYAPYAQALAHEIARAGDALGHPPARTIFIGGGTPTVLPVPLLAEIMDAIHRAFVVAPEAEITSEANPGTVDRARFSGLRALGINRLSMGAQSFDDEELRFLGRIHSAEDIERAFTAARAAGFDNINLDLIYGLPGQKAKTWTRTLARTLTLAPEHISCYSLTVEVGTPLARWVAAGSVPPPDDDLAADLYEEAQATLAEAGYEHYEISNWARLRNFSSPPAPPPLPEAGRGVPGHIPPSPYRSRHNLIYWRNEPYLGFGPGAHSSLDGRRWWNIRSPVDYIRRLAAGEGVMEGEETIGDALAMGETMMLGLRLLPEGVGTEEFAARHGRSLEEVYATELRELQEWGLLEMLDGRVRLTPRGRLLGNQVFQRFLP
jgi:oxygen-independent coproporphyrinogen-3 oxidase